jgi:DUF4097 and DUF4098 domain-containing protein YvlB
MKYKKWIVGGLAAALLATCGLIVAVTALTYAQFAQSGIRFSAFRFDTVSAEATEEQRFSVSAPAKLIVDSDAGAVVVTGDDTSEIVVTMHKTAWGPNQAEAEAARDALRVNIIQQGDTVSIRFEQPSEFIVIGSSRSSRVDFTIMVPNKTAVNITTNSGKLALSGTTGNADLNTNFGEITATEMVGSLKAQTNSGAVTAQHIQAEGGQVDLRSDFGAIALEDANAKSVTLHSSSGKLELTDVTSDGEVKADTNFGAVTFNHVTAKTYSLESNSGDLTVEGATGLLKAHTDFGSIQVTDVQTVTLDLKTNSGSIDFSGSLGKGPHTVKTDFGTVKMALPKDVKLTVDLKTDFGKVKTNFPITVSGEMSNEHMRGALNGGGEMLTVGTNSGDINLEVLNP